ncbi:MAG: hypothetical protein MRY63_03635 [Neomegalonema sp.]|nr:hypothetical protein [Neomegalonema sp.]
MKTYEADPPKDIEKAHERGEENLRYPIWASVATAAALLVGGAVALSYY